MLLIYVLILHIYKFINFIYNVYKTEQMYTLQKVWTWFCVLGSPAWVEGLHQTTFRSLL